MKIMKKLLQATSLAIIALLFTGKVLMAQTATAPAGSGTKQDPYQIETLENLYWFTQVDSVWEKHFIQTANIDASPTTGWDNDSGFTPIALGVGFNGTYNGKGHSIDSLYINRPNHNYLALFAFNNNDSKIDSLSVTNLNIKGVAMKGGGFPALATAPSTTAPPRGVLAGMK